MTNDITSPPGGGTYDDDGFTASSSGSGRGHDFLRWNTDDQWTDRDGAPARDLERIFEPFFRGSRPEGDGSGLGLSIVKRVVERLGGSIALENIRGTGRSGLRVTVRLPLAADPSRESSRAD
jgi:hypothetical protein